MLRIAAAADPPAGGGLEARPPAVPLAWPSGVEIDDDVVDASLRDRTRWLPGGCAEAGPGRVRAEGHIGSKHDEVGDLDELGRHVRAELRVELDGRSDLDVAGPLDELARRRRQARRARSGDRQGRSGRVEPPDASLVAAIRDVEPGHEIGHEVGRDVDRAFAAPGPSATLEDRVRALRALRMARARRLARALIAAVSRAP